MKFDLETSYELITPAAQPLQVENPDYIHVYNIETLIMNWQYI